MSDQTTLTEALAATGRLVERALERYLPVPETDEARVVEAMRYAFLSGGKRLRPFLVMATADLFGVDREAATRAALAVECVHCYSLVHDDLPAMDDDDLRRGKPTVHKAFDEATAILAGDGLLTFAFDVLADPATHADPNVRCRLVRVLARASGHHGMVGGQMIDLSADHTASDVAYVTRLQQMKTGALIVAAVELGAILGKASDHRRHTLVAYARAVGLAFQIADDLLDVEGATAEVGKATGKDADAGKATLVSLLGVDRARAQADALVQQAVDCLSDFGEKAALLRATARFAVERSR